MMTDPIADALTRIRNAGIVRMAQVNILASKTVRRILDVVADEGFVAGYQVEDRGGPRPLLVVELKYGPDGKHIIRSIQRVSKPGCRIYRKCDELEPVQNGQGIAIVSTPEGVMSDRLARERRLGGEVFAEVY